MSHRICTECGLIWIAGTAYDNAWHEGRMCPACLETTGVPFERAAMSVERMRAAARYCPPTRAAIEAERQAEWIYYD